MSAINTPIVPSKTTSENTENEFEVIESSIGDMSKKTPVSPSSGEEQQQPDLENTGRAEDKPQDEEEEEEEAGMKAESKRLYDSGTTRPGEDIDWLDEMPEKFKNEGDVEAARRGYAILLRTQLVGRRQKLHSIVVQSPLLKDALKGIMSNYPGLLLAKDPLVFDAPFKAFVHRWHEFCEACSKHKDERTREHLNILKSAVEPELKEPFQAIENFAKYGAIEFDYLWTVFSPSSIVIAMRNKAQCAFKIRKTENKIHDGQMYFILHCYFVDWNGKGFGRSLSIIAIPHFEGSSTMSDLPAYPLEYHPEKDAVRALLLERGTAFRNLAGVCYRAYDGIGIDYTRTPPAFLNVNGRIVVDAQTYFRFNANLDIPLGTLQPSKAELEESDGMDGSPEWGIYRSDLYQTMYRNEEQMRQDAMTNTKTNIDDTGDGSSNKLGDEELILCRHLVRGYSLKLKRWLDFSIPCIQDIRWNSTAFDSLALPNSYKYLLLSFAKTQASTTSTTLQFDDVISGKGKGMVMLLEGPPGVGKTLTVESVAEEMQVPLYSISAGMLGTDAIDVQDRLNDAFEIATAWKAVILLDEADVFLEKREISDLQRNQLVSIFLQGLEYYTGTIFLTTNRVACIDPAFNSRIHISLPYAELTAQSRKKIWTTFLTNMTDTDTSEVLDDERQIDDYADKDLNGRQIKNIVKMAGLLAVSEGGKLKEEHIETVLDIVSMQEGNRNRSYASGK